MNALSTDLITSNVDPDISAAMVVYERLKPLQDALGLKDLTVAEMQLFAMVAHHTGLDPFTKQIYAIKRSGKVTHQTGIDGYRSSAERTREYAGSEEATFEDCGCGSDDSPPIHPRKARVVIHRILPSGHVVNQAGVALWHELKPKHFKPQGAYGFMDDMWWQMPFNQLAKCAEANGLRKAFPRVLGGVYITDEMQQAEVVEGTAKVVAPAVRDRIAARRAEAEAAIEGEVVSDTASPPQTPQDAAPATSGADVQSAAPVAVAPASAAARGACGSEDKALDTGPCERPAGHVEKSHRNSSGTWPV